MGQSPDGSTYNTNRIGTVFYQGRAEFNARYPSRRLYTTDPKRMAGAGDILLSVRAPVGDLNIATESCCIGRGLASLSSDYPYFLYYLLKLNQHKLAQFNGEGTVFGSINSKSLKQLTVKIPNTVVIQEFNNFISPNEKLMLNNFHENNRLIAIRDNLLSSLF
jgi:type I restriction enzyme S subunit